MRNKPRIRFKGFTEDWEQRKLGAMCSLFTDGDWIESKDQSNEGIRLIQTGNIGVGKFIDKPENKKWISHSTFDNLRCKELLDGDILISRLPHPAGRACIVSTNNEKWITAVDCTIVRLLDRYSNKFILQSLCTYNYFHLIDSFLAGGTRQRVSRSNLSDINIMSPEKIEQDKIGLFFECIDNLITLHQRKLEKLKLAKKALLQKLFPKNGSQFPEIRFKGFTDAWEQRKLDDIAKIKTGGGTPKTANPEYWSGNIPWIQSSDLVEGDIVHVNINKFINNNALKNSAAKLISRDSIALVTRVGVGKVAVINQDFTTSQDFLSLSDFDGNDIKFLAYQLYRLMQENAKVLQGTSIKGITKTELIEQSISIPSSGQEQNLISNVLSKIDSFITLHQCKLDKLQDVKKGLLQKMFV